MAENVENQQQQDPAKEEKKYQEALVSLLGILGTEGKPLLSKKKASVSTIDKVVSEMLKEDDETFEKTLKEEITKTIQAKIKLDDEISKKKKELADVEKKSKKDFTEQATKLMNKIGDRKAMYERYKATLSETVSAGTTQAKEDGTTYSDTAGNIA